MFSFDFKMFIELLFTLKKPIWDKKIMSFVNILHTFLVRRENRRAFL